VKLSRSAIVNIEASDIDGRGDKISADRRNVAKRGRVYGEQECAGLFLEELTGQDGECGAAADLLGDHEQLGVRVN
jgi:hypothetical protein